MGTEKRKKAYTQGCISVGDLVETCMEGAAFIAEDETNMKPPHTCFRSHLFAYESCSTANPAQKEGNSKSRRKKNQRVELA